MFRGLILAILVISLCACERIAVLATPKKEPIPSCTALAATAENQFWSTLHSGNYQTISEADRLLTAAYLENPNDPKIAAHLGFLHIWKITERAREKPIPPTIVNEIILSKKYFKDAVLLDPSDPRFLGFLGDSQLAEGKIFHDERQEVHGYFTVKRAIRSWPQFNYFTGGYAMSVLPANSKHFQEGLKWQWKTMDLCAHDEVDRAHPSFKPYMKLETRQGWDRACWNSWIAPYNFEGFFLNMGDMLVKNGDWKTGIKIYRNAKLAKNYSAWPYRELLEKRIQDARQNVSEFRKETISTPEHTILFNSGYGCVACHQAG